MLDDAAVIVAISMAFSDSVVSVSCDQHNTVSWLQNMRLFIFLFCIYTQTMGQIMHLIKLAFNRLYLNYVDVYWLIIDRGNFFLIICFQRRNMTFLPGISIKSNNPNMKQI